ncbi:MAG: hypothetical protein ACREGJ_01235 [Candidatus Saccharimonadales bacterium]
MNDFVIMIALFVIFPILGLVLVFFTVRADAADPRHKTVPHDNKKDIEEHIYG